MRSGFVLTNYFRWNDVYFVNAISHIQFNEWNSEFSGNTTRIGVCKGRTCVYIYIITTREVMKCMYVYCLTAATGVLWYVCTGLVSNRKQNTMKCVDTFVNKIN